MVDSPPLCVTCWKVLSYLLLYAKVIFAQCDCNFSRHLIPYVGNSAINLLLCTSLLACKRFQNSQALSVSVGNSYSEDQIMHTFLDNFYQSGKYSSQLARHQSELRREEKYPDQKCLNISSLQTDYLNLDNSNSGSIRHNEKANSVQTKCTYCGLNNHSVEKCFKRIRKEKEKARSAGTSFNKDSDRPARKCFRCGSEDHMIAKCPKPPKDSENKTQV